MARNAVSNLAPRSGHSAKGAPALKLQVVYKDPKTLKPRANNPRTHSRKQIGQLQRSIREYGFIRAVLIDGDDGIVAGHGSTLAAIALGMTDIPAVRVDHLTPAQIRAYVIADNKLAENSGWDRNLLALELKELTVNLDFDIGPLGFETAEVDLLIGELDESPDVADEIPTLETGRPAVSRRGDLWQIGVHRLICADSTRAETYAALLQGSKAQAVFTDPPYNLRIDGNVSGLGRHRHREFPMASGELTSSAYTQFLLTVCTNLRDFSIPGSLHYICMDWRHMGELLAAGAKFTELKNVCVWAKTNAGMGSLYRSQYELVSVFKNGTAAHINNVELGRFGRNRSNLWTYAGVNTFSKHRDAELAMHPTVKPVAMVADAILDSSHRGGIVLDAFAGSGTTLIAAEKTGRRGCGIELDPLYCDTIIRRFADVYGIKAIHANSGLDFNALACARASDQESRDVE
ncbi:MAG TPA: DNA methyltransferase [Terracidiphilus sp.]|jgi:DNA modification methylase